MAEKTKTTVGAAEDAAPAVKESKKAEVTEKRLDETVPGGAYMVGGKMVDADGKEI